MFDADDPRTFARRPTRPVFRWLRRVAYLFLAVLLLAGGAVWWVWHGWHDEQWRLSELRQHFGNRPNELTVKFAPLSGWLQCRLPDRFGIYLERVTDVQLFWTGATDEDLKLVGGLTHLRGLMLQGPFMTDAGMAHLKGLTGLQTLRLSSELVTDAGLANLVEMRRMQDLTIEGGKVTNAGLEYFNEMTGLRWLTVCMNPITRDGLVAWMRRHPGVQVVDGPEEVKIDR